MCADASATWRRSTAMFASRARARPISVGPTHGLRCRECLSCARFGGLVPTPARLDRRDRSLHVREVTLGVDLAQSPHRSLDRLARPGQLQVKPSQRGQRVRQGHLAAVPQLLGQWTEHSTSLQSAFGLVPLELDHREPSHAIARNPVVALSRRHPEPQLEKLDGLLVVAPVVPDDPEADRDPGHVDTEGHRDALRLQEHGLGAIHVALDLREAATRRRQCMRRGRRIRRTARLRRQECALPRPLEVTRFLAQLRHVVQRDGDLPVQPEGLRLEGVTP